MSLELALKVDQEPQNWLLHTTQVFNAVIALSGIAKTQPAPPIPCGFEPVSVETQPVAGRPPIEQIAPDGGGQSLPVNRRLHQPNPEA
jgi:hypothetical protein